MNLYNGKILHSYERTKLPIENNFIEQVKQFSSDKKVPLVKDKYPMFEWAPVIPILDETQEETLDMIDEDGLEVEDVEINDYDNGQGEDKDKRVLNIIEENQEPVNEEVIYITEEEVNNEVVNTDI